MKATYVSVWDGGIEISTSCEYEPIIHDVTDIETSDVDGLENLEREYIILPDGTEIEREDFTIDGDLDNELTDDEITKLRDIFKAKG